jgi:hypothetical protein
MPLLLINLGNLYASDMSEQVCVWKQVQLHYYRRSLWRHGVVSAYVKYVLALS